jgi:hypothetical protein
MLAAKNKYDAMVEKGTWNAPTAEEKIVTLEAKLASTMKTINKKVSFELGKKGTGKGKKAVDKHGKANDGDHPKTWDPPKTGEKRERKYRTYTWYWCGKDTGGKCEKWRAHKPKECKGAAPSAESKAKRPVETDERKEKRSAAKKLKIAKAYVAKMEKVAEDNVTDEDESE